MSAKFEMKHRKYRKTLEELRDMLKGGKYTEALIYINARLGCVPIAKAKKELIPNVSTTRRRISEISPDVLSQSVDMWIRGRREEAVRSLVSSNGIGLRDAKLYLKNKSKNKSKWVVADLSWTDRLVSQLSKN